MVSGSLLKASIRFFCHHPWQLGLTLLSIALGSAVMIAVDLANNSARQSFDQTINTITGIFTHSLIAESGYIDERFYVELRLTGQYPTAIPIVEGVFKHNGEVFSMLGTDPIALVQAVSDTSNSQQGILPLFTRPESAVLTRATANLLNLSNSSTLDITIDGRSRTMPLVVLPDSDGRFLPDEIILVDIALAQDIFTKTGGLDRIDLILNQEQEQAIRAHLPEGLKLEAIGAKGNALDQMTRAFRTNLTAMSFLAILVSAFLVYNTMTFSVLQRRQHFATQRMIGVTGGNLATHIVLEALALGLLGSLAGCILGVILGQGLLWLVTRTISDLYAAIDISVLLIHPVLLLKGVGLTLCAVLLATIGPALEAAKVPPVNVHRRSSAEIGFSRLSLIFSAAGLVLAAFAVILIQVDERNLITAFAGLFLLVLAWSFTVPIWVDLLLFLARKASPEGRVFWSMAVRGIQSARSRTLLSITALAIAVSATIGVGVMISSFRLSVASWLEQTLQSDLYMVSAADSANSENGFLDPVWPDLIRSIPGVQSVSTGETRSVNLFDLPIPMLILDPGVHSENGFRLLGSNETAVWQKFEMAESILISEPLAWHHNLQAGDTLFLQGGNNQSFSVLIGGIYQDYSASQGMLVMARKLYNQHWSDRHFSSIGIYLNKDADAQRVRKRLSELTTTTENAVAIRSNVEIRQRSLNIFDQTFAITDVLRLLVVLVAFVGVFSALMAQSLERTREFAILRSSGMTPMQLLWLVLLQTGCIGLLAGILALPPGWFMADILIDVINQRSFGWTMDKVFPPNLMIQAIVLSVMAALVAGLYPARRIVTRPVAQGLRDL